MRLAHLLMVLASLATLLAAGNAPASELYSFSGGQLVTVGLTPDGSFNLPVTPIGPTGAGTPPGLDFPLDGMTLYGARAKKLISFDIVTGAGTVLGPVPAAAGASLVGLSFVPSTGMLLASTDGKQLVEIDPRTRVATVVGTTGTSTVGALAYRPAR